MKKTKGKQKIEMKLVEDYKARMATFSKRKKGIIKKMNEIIAVCDVNASFLVFSQTGKAHSFAHPSMEDAVGRVNSSLRDEPFEKDGTEQLVEAYKRQKTEELKKMYADLAEELKMVEEEENNLKGSESGKESDKKWWKEVKDMSMEELMRKHQYFVKLNANLCGTASQEFGKDIDGSSSDLA